MKQSFEMNDTIVFKSILMPVTIQKAADQNLNSKLILKKECLKMSNSNQKSLFPRYNQRYSGGKASGNFIVLRNTTKNS